MRRRSPYHLFGWIVGLTGGVLICLGVAPLLTRIVEAFHIGAPWWAAFTIRSAILMSVGLANCYIGHLLIRSTQKGAR